jgi:GNAT superfamily N-acetyltransferase
MSTRFRWATLADVASIASLWHRTWHQTYAQHLRHRSGVLKRCDCKWFERRVGASLYEHDGSEPEASRTVRPTALVAEHCGGGAVGFAVIGGGAEIQHIYVSHEQHGSGLAADLLAHAEQRMLERGSELAHLVVAVSNLRARRFYEKHGWIATDRQPWMCTAPWEAMRPAELRLPEPLASEARDDRGGLTEEEIEMTTMRCGQFKKFLGYDQPLVPRLRSY